MNAVRTERDDLESGTHQTWRHNIAWERHQHQTVQDH